MRDLNKWLEWTATFTTIAGAIFTVLKWDPLNIILLNTASLIFAIWAWRINKPSLIVTNGGLLIIYLTGIIIRAHGY